MQYFWIHVFHILPMYFRTVVVLIAAMVFGPVAIARAADAPRWQAGYRSINADGATGTQPLPITVWYPTTQRERSFRTGPFAMRVAASATMAEGDFAVIALSHGAFGRPINHRDLAIALAHAGYIVIAPQHDLKADAAGFGDVRQREGRPGELMLALRAVRSHPAFASHFDARRVGAIGYSAGGYAVLAAMRARSDWSDAAGHCLLHFISDRNFCFGGSGGQDRRQGVAGVVTAKTHARVPVQPSAPLQIRAAVLLAPVAAVFSADGLTSVRQPVRIYSAEHDQKLNSRFHGDWLYATLKAQGTPVELVSTHAGHYVFMSPFPDAIKTSVGDAAQDPPGFDRLAFQQRLARETIAFFGRTLRR